MQRVIGVGGLVKDDVVAQRDMLGLDARQRLNLAGVHDGGVEARLHALVQEHGVEHHARSGIEAERHVRDAAGDQRVGQVLLDPRGGLDEVEAVGGVNVCVEYPSRDKHTGLFMKAGCSTLDGVEGLAYARSRFFEQKVDGEWQLDGSSDIGRSTRQRGFVQALAKSAVIGVSGNPFKAGDVLNGGLSAVVVDNNLDLIEFAKKLRPAAGGNIASFPLDVYGDMVGSNSVLRLGKGADELIAFFNGTGPRPQLNP